MFNKLTVDYYGAPTPLQQLASFQNARGRAPSSSPRSTSPRCTRSRGPSATPTSASTRATTATIIRCVLPELTEERRREYIKLAHHKAEEARVSVRNIRRKAKDDLDKLVKDGEVGEDDGTRAEKELDGADQEARRPRRRAAQGTRRPSCSRSEPRARPDDDDDSPSEPVEPTPAAQPRRRRRAARARPARPGARRLAGPAEQVLEARAAPAATCRPPSASGVGLGVARRRPRLFIRKEAFLVARRGRRVRRRSGSCAAPCATRAVRVPLVPAARRRGRDARRGLRRAAPRRWSCLRPDRASPCVLWRAPTASAAPLRDVLGGIFVAAYLPFLAGFASLLLAPRRRRPADLRLHPGHRLQRHRRLAVGRALRQAPDGADRSARRSPGRASPARSLLCIVGGVARGPLPARRPLVGPASLLGVGRRRRRHPRRPQRVD